MNLSAFTHRFEAGTDFRAPVLLLLHGTGGDENDLLALGRTLAPGAPLLSPRGRVLERGMPRFFRRLAEGVFDEASIRAEAAALTEWLPVATAHYGVGGRPIIAVGFSNGANFAAALLLLHPGTLDGAVLLRAMVPLEPAVPPRLVGVGVLLLSGATDPLVPVDNASRLAALLREVGAAVEHVVLAAGHGLSREDIARASAWVAQEPGSSPDA
jgi:phospholipase/carboxylesterase